MTNKTDCSKRSRAGESKSSDRNNTDRKSWFTEAPMRMLMTLLDPERTENPEELVFTAVFGRAGREIGEKINGTKIGLSL